jgi:hypothetical protein
MPEFTLIRLAAKSHQEERQGKRQSRISSVTGEQTQANHDMYTIQLITLRDSRSVIYNVCFSLFVIDCLVFTGHGIPIGNLSDRLSVNLTLLLTTMAFKWYLNESLPNVPCAFLFVYQCPVCVFVLNL